MNSETDPPPGLDALRKFEWVPPEARGPIVVPTTASTPFPVTRARPTRGGMPPYLSQFAVVWGAVVVLYVGVEGLSGTGWERAGEMAVFLVSVAVALTAGWQLANERDEDRVMRYFLPPIGIVLGAVILLHLTVGGPTFSPYPAATQVEFLVNCDNGYMGQYLNLDQTTPAECRCALSWFESHKSLTDYNAVFADMRAGDGIPWDVSAGMNSCLSQ